MGMAKDPKIVRDEALVSINPATGEDLDEVTIASPDRVRDAVDRAREAADDWAALPIDERARYVERAREILLEEADEIALLLVEEVGKTLVDAMAAEIAVTADLMHYFCVHAEEFLTPEAVDIRFWGLAGRKSYVHHPPRGVVGVIAPWNYPLHLALGPVTMALIAGNTVVLKPSEVTPLAGEKVGELFRRAGLPEGVLQVVQGPGETGAALTSHDLDLVVFTGSVSTGKKVIRAAAEHLTPVVAELGGKDPMVVLEDADLDVAVDGAVWAAFSNAGQTCASVERLYVDESIEEEFVELLRERTGRIRQGLGDDYDVDMGSMTSLRQLELVDRQVREARDGGADVVTGGGRNEDLEDGFFYRPTVLRGVDHEMTVMRDESFGPLLGVMPFSSEAEAVELANDSPYGLTASVWSSDVERAEELGRQLVAGTVTVNDHLTTAGMPEVPWGGEKESGVGRLHGRVGLLAFTQARHVHVNRMSHVKAPWWFPYHRHKYEAMKAMGHAVSDRGILARARAAKDLVVNLIRGE